MTSTISDRSSATVVGLFAAAALLTIASPCRAQVAGRDAFSIAAGGDLPGGADGAAAGFSANPAGLAGAEGWAFAFAPLQLDLSLGPVTGRDIARIGGGVLSRERRESWVARIGAEGQRGGVDASVGPLSIRRGSVALEISTRLVGRSRLPADAVELLLFGNAGRDGEAGDFRLTGSALDGAVWTRIGLGFGMRPDPAAQPRLSVGARVHATVGHALLVTRDAGSVSEGGDATATLLLPSIATTGGGATPGFGIGFDLGATWRAGGGVTGVSLHDAVSTFDWSESALRYRAGEAIIEGEGVETEFDARPVTEAPASLRALARRVRPARRIEVEHARPLGDRLLLRLTLRERIESGLAPGRPDARLLGIEWGARRWIEVAAHAGAVDGRARVGTGARVALGRWRVSAAWSVDRGDGVTGSSVALSVAR